MVDHSYVLNCGIENRENIGNRNFGGVLICDEGWDWGNWDIWLLIEGSVIAYIFSVYRHRILK